MPEGEGNKEKFNPKESAHGYKKSFENMSNQERNFSSENFSGFLEQTEKPETEEALSFNEKINSFISKKEGSSLLDESSPLFRIAKLATFSRNQSLDGLKKLLQMGDEFYAKNEVKEEDWALLAGVIEEKISELIKFQREAEPEIEKLVTPESVEGALEVFFDETFHLHERGLREGKKWEETGGLFSEYTALQRWIKNLPQKLRGKECKDELLITTLKREYPQGIFLKEKMELFLEAMKRLHNRQIEVIKSEGGLEDLGVSKGSEPGVPILKVPLTNIRPRDWYILFHVDEIFSEIEDKDKKFELQLAWDKWQEIGKYPYALYEYKRGKKGELEEIIAYFKDDENDEISDLLKEKDFWEKLESGIYKWDQVRWNLDILKRVKKFKDEDELKEGRFFKIENFLSSERAMARLRESIVRFLEDNGVGRRTAIYSESLIHAILTVDLAFYVWDRERWKDSGKMDARDLMWFDWKRIKRFTARDVRPAGPWDTVGCFFADDELMREYFSKENKNRDIESYLKKNRKRALFVVYPYSPSIGTIVGDFFNSKICKLKEEKEEVKEGKLIKRLVEVKKRLSEVKKLKEIPWLDPFQFEEETYEGHFTYNLMFASAMEDTIKQLEWDPNKLKSKDFWVKLTDLTLRLEHFCPTLIKYENNHALIYRFRRHIARGILWTGSYLATANPKNILASGAFSKEDVYGETIFGFIPYSSGILDAIKVSGFLDEKNFKRLKAEVHDFNFYLRGALPR